MRINKRERRKHRKWARQYDEKAKLIEHAKPEEAATLRTIAAMDARLGAPPKSKKRRKKNNP